MQSPVGITFFKGKNGKFSPFLKEMLYSLLSNSANFCAIVGLFFVSRLTVKFTKSNKNFLSYLPSFYGVLIGILDNCYNPFHLYFAEYNLVADYYNKIVYL